MNRPSNAGLIRMVYWSRHFDLELGHLRRMLASSRRNNALLGVTGLVIHSQDAFLQVLEGAPDVVRYTYARIALDMRHYDLRVLSDKPVNDRLFPDWSMAAVSLESGQLRHLADQISAHGERTDDLISGFVDGLKPDVAAEPPWAHHEAWRSVQRSLAAPG